MDENNNLNVTETPVTNETPVAETPVTPVAPVEAAPVAEAAPAPVVSTPVEPTPVVSSPAVAPTPEVAPAPEEPKKKKSNVLVVILLVLVLLGVVCYGLYTYTDIFKGKEKTDNNTTTTTTTTAAAVETELAFKTVDEYVAAVKANNKKDGSLIIDLSASYNYVDFDMNNKCANDGDEISLESGSNTVKYTCKKAETDPICEVNWNGTVKVNDKLSMDYTSCIECRNEKLYAGPKGYLNVVDSGCAVNLFHNAIEFFNAEGTSLGKSSFSNVYSTKEDYSDQTAVYPVVKDNVVYFLAGVDADNDTQANHTTCTLKYVDFNSTNPTIKSTESSITCYGEDV